MNGLNIGEVAKRAGLRASALRYYESIGLLPPPSRASGWRRYEPTVVDRLRVIRAAREMGFTLDEIRTLLDGFPAETAPPERWRALARAKLPEIEALIQRARAIKRLLETGLECQCVRIEDCFLEDCAGTVKRARRSATLPLAPGRAPAAIREADRVRLGG